MANIARQGGSQQGSRRNPAGGAPPPTLPTLVEINEPRCHVCQSPYRREIDACLASGWSQAMVIRQFNGMVGSEYFTRGNLSRHKLRHLSSRDAAVRNIIEERARQLQVDTELAENFILTKQATLDVIIQSGLEQLRAGLTESAPKDIIAAIQMLEKMEADFASLAIEETTMQYVAFADAVQELVSPELGAKIYDRTNQLLAERKQAKRFIGAEAPRALEADYDEEDDE